MNGGRRNIVGVQGCLCLSVLVAACSVRDGVLGNTASIPDGGAAGESCGKSPVVAVSQYPTCTNRLAASVFSNALCSCHDLQVGASLTTRGFDSSAGPYREGAPGGTGAAVGVDGNVTVGLAGATLDVGGSFSSAGTLPLQITGTLQVAGDYFAAGSVSVSGLTSVTRNAWLGGTFSSLGPLTVGGDLHHADNVTAASVSVGSSERDPVVVAPPCPCRDDELVPIAALVDAAKARNDNARLGVLSTGFIQVPAGSEWNLPCGQVYLSQIAGVGSLTVHVTGMAALFIDGSINLVGGLAFDLAPGAEIDVFVKGDLAVQGPLVLAGQDRPAAGRMWVNGILLFPLSNPWVGNLYAPHSYVGTATEPQIWGSIVAGDLNGGTHAAVVFDRAIMHASACTAPEPPAGLCARCSWCTGGAACMDGLCGSCQSDADCCSLSACSSNGQCEPLLTLAK